MYMYVQIHIQAKNAVSNVEFKFFFQNPNHVCKKNTPHQLTVEVSSSSFENILRLYAKCPQGNHNSLEIKDCMAKVNINNWAATRKLKSM